jgi:hypothetical protein
MAASEAASGAGVNFAGGCCVLEGMGVDGVEVGADLQPASESVAATTDTIAKRPAGFTSFILDNEVLA